MAVNANIRRLSAVRRSRQFSKRSLSSPNANSAVETRAKEAGFPCKSVTTRFVETILYDRVINRKEIYKQQAGKCNRASFFSRFATV